MFQAWRDSHAPGIFTRIQKALEKRDAPYWLIEDGFTMPVHPDALVAEPQYLYPIDEKEIYDLLGLPFIPADQRHANGYARAFSEDFRGFPHPYVYKFPDCDTEVATLLRAYRERRDALRQQVAQKDGTTWVARLDAAPSIKELAQLPGQYQVSLNKALLRWHGRTNGQQGELCAAKNYTDYQYDPDDYPFIEGVRIAALMPFCSNIPHYLVGRYQDVSGFNPDRHIWMAENILHAVQRMRNMPYDYTTPEGEQSYNLILMAREFWQTFIHGKLPVVEIPMTDILGWIEKTTGS